MVAFILLGAMALACSIPLYQRYIKYASLNALPSPAGGLPVLGHLPVLMKAIGTDSLYPQFAQWAKELGDVYVYWLYGKPNVVISRPAAIEELLIKKIKEGAIARHDISNKVWHTVFGGPTMENQNGEPWQWRRKAWTPSFSMTQLMESQVTLISNNCAELIERLKQNARNGEVVEADRAFIGFTMKTICEILFADSTQEASQKTLADYDALYAAIDRCERQLIAEYSPQKWLKYLPNEAGRSYWNSKRYIKEFVTPHVDKALAFAKTVHEVEEGASGLDGHSLLAYIAARQEKYDRASLEAESFLMIAAGSDTTAHSISFVLGILGTQPEIFAKARAQVDSAWEQHGGINAAAIGSLSYVEGLVKEAIRLYPVGGGSFPCEVKQELVVEGHTIPKGAELFWSLIAANRHPEEYKEPEKVLPERWLKADGPAPRMLSFGTGAHRCLGERLAILESTIVVAMLIRHLDWQLLNGEASLQNLAHKFVLCPADKMPVRFSLRAGA